MVLHHFIARGMHAADRLCFMMSGVTKGFIGNDFSANTTSSESFSSRLYSVTRKPVLKLIQGVNLPSIFLPVRNHSNSRLPTASVRWLFWTRSARPARICQFLLELRLGVDALGIDAVQVDQAGIVGIDAHHVRLLVEEIIEVVFGFQDAAEHRLHALDTEIFQRRPGRERA